MSLKTLISTAVLLGSTTAALAQPSTSWSASANWRWSWGARPTTNVRDHRYHRPVYQPVYEPESEVEPEPVYQPVIYSPERLRSATYDTDFAPTMVPPVDTGLHTVATINNAFDTRQSGPVVIDVGAYGIPSHKLILTSTGNSEVFDITVFYADGTRHTFNWNHLFNAPTSDGQAGSQLVMSGTGTPITRIVLSGYNAWNTQMKVMIQS